MLPEIKTILDTLPSERVLRNRRPDATPLDDLIEAYALLVQNRPGLLPYSAEWTGQHFKNALSLLEPEDQRALFSSIYARTGKYPADAWTYTDENPASRGNDLEDRHMRIWLTKWLITTSTVLGLMLIGGVIALLLKNGVSQNSGLPSQVISTAAEIIKLVLMSPTTK